MDLEESLLRLMQILRRLIFKMRQIKKPVEVKMHVYASNFEISAKGDINREQYLYVIGGWGSHGIHKKYGEDGFVRRGIGFEVKMIKEKYPNVEISIDFPEQEYNLNSFIDGHFGRPIHHAKTTVLRPLGKRARSKIRSLVKQLSPDLGVRLAS